MNTKRIKILAIEIFKTIDKLLVKLFMKGMFIRKINPRIRRNNIIAKNGNTTTYGDKYVTTPGHRAWNSPKQTSKI